MAKESRGRDITSGQETVRTGLSEPSLDLPESPTIIEIVKPTLEHLPSYKAALERGWSPDNVRLMEATREQLAAIDEDPAAFLASLDDPEAKGGPITLPDGTTVPRLPGFRRWIWDGEAAGSIGFRWQPGTAALPSHVLGHIGYAVVPLKRGRGYATEALRLMLEEARAVGLPYVEITTDLDNPASAEGGAGQWRPCGRSVHQGRRVWRRREFVVPDRFVVRRYSAGAGSGGAARLRPSQM